MISWRLSFAKKFINLPMVLAAIGIPLLTISGPADASADSPGILILSADIGGRVAACQPCGGRQEWEGLARRARLISRLKNKNASILLVDAGNALFGPDSILSQGRLIVSAYDCLKYDAINLSYRDFRLGKAATLAALEEARFAALSTNVLDDETGDLLGKPFVIRQSGRRRLALIGVTQEPPSLDSLPHLKEQLEGIRVVPPVDALTKWLPGAKAEADQVILLYYGTPSGLQPIREKLGRQIDLILVGGTVPAYLPKDAKPPLVATGGRGRQLAQVKLSGQGDDLKVQVEQLEITADIQPDPEMEELLASFSKPTPVPLPDMTAKAEAVPTPTLPTSLNVNQIYPLYLQASNRAVRLTVNDVVVRDRYGGVKPSSGQEFLAVHTRWENTIPLTLIAEREIPTQYLIRNLADHFYLLVNGHRASQVMSFEDDLPGQIPISPFLLETLGDRLDGNVLFEIPADGVETLELRYYDYSHGHMTVPLKHRKLDAEVAPAEPLIASRKNEFLEMAVFDVRRSGENQGETAPDEMEFVTVDLRARSRFTFEADATAFDPKADERDTLEVGTVADWKDAHKYIHLVIDAEYAYAPQKQSTLPKQPRFLPDVMTGDEVVFLCPKEAKTWELRCDFPNAQAPGDDEIIHPEPLTFRLEGKRPRLRRQRAVTSIEDEDLEVKVVQQQSSNEFAGVRLKDDDLKFLVLDITVENSGDKGEFFQTEKQLQYVDRDGDQSPIDKITYKGIFRPTKNVWIPPDARRSFQLVFRIPDRETRPRVAYSGYSLAKVLRLEPLDE